MKYYIDTFILWSSALTFLKQLFMYTIGV